jgi:hypothetical protein
MQILRWLNWADTLQHGKEKKLYNSPQCRERSLRKNSYSSIHEERRANQIKSIIGARCNIYTPFSNLLARGFSVLPVIRSGTTNTESFGKDLK